MRIQERFALAAERLEGVRFVHHGRDPRVGLDCVGLVLVPAREVGVEFEDRPYVLSPGADFWSPMVAVIETAADSVEDAKGRPELWERGDVLGCRFGEMRNHLGIYLGGGWLLHAEPKEPIKRAVRIPMDAAYKRMVSVAWRLRG